MIARTWVIASAILLALAAPSCSSPAEPAAAQSPELDRYSAQQKAELADGRATDTEYHGAFRRYQSCLADAGYELLTSTNGSDGRLNYAVPDAAVTSGADDQCYVAEFAGVDDLWQLAHEDSSPTAQILRACMRKLGLPDDGSITEMVEALDTMGVDPLTC